MFYGIRGWGCVGIALVLHSVLSGDRAAGQQSPPGPAEDLIAHYETYLRNFDTCAYAAAVTTRSRGGRLPADSVVGEDKYRVWHDGQAWRCVLLGTSTVLDKNGKVEKSRWGTEWAVRPRGSVMVGIDPDSGSGESIIALLGEVPESQRVPVVSMSIEFLHGLDRDSRRVRLPDVLRASRTKVEADGPLQVIRATGPWGSWGVWLDPAKGYAVTRLELIKSADDWCAPQKKLGELKVGGYHRPRSTYTGITRRIVVTSWATAGTVSYPAAFIVTTEERFANNQTVVFTDEVRVSEVSFGAAAVPPAALTVGTPIKNGTRVTVEDSPNIEYEWEDGKIVKRIDRAVVASLEQWDFRPEPWWRRYRLEMAAGLVGAAAAAGLVWWWRRYRRPRIATLRGG